MIVDIPYNWRKAKLRKNIQYPSLNVILDSANIHEQSIVFLKWNEIIDVINIRDWIADNMTGKLSIYGRFEYIETYDFLDCLGLTFEFSNNIDFVYFKLKW